MLFGVRAYGRKADEPAATCFAHMLLSAYAPVHKLLSAWAPRVSSLRSNRSARASRICSARILSPLEPIRASPLRTQPYIPQGWRRACNPLLHSTGVASSRLRAVEQNCPKLSKTVQNAPKRSKNCPKLSKTVQNAPKRSKNCPKLSKTDQNGPKRSKWSQPAPAAERRSRRDRKLRLAKVSQT